MPNWLVFKGGQADPSFWRAQPFAGLPSLLLFSLRNWRDVELSWRWGNIRVIAIRRRDNCSLAGDRHAKSWSTFYRLSFYSELIFTISPSRPHIKRKSSIFSTVWKINLWQCWWLISLVTYLVHVLRKFFLKLTNGYFLSKNLPAPKKSKRNEIKTWEHFYRCWK